MPIASRLRHAITVNRWTQGGTTDSRGRRDDSWIDDPDPIPGNIQRRSSRELVDENGDAAISDAIGFLAIDAAVSSRDRLKEGSSTYLIVGPPRDAGGRGRHLELDLRLVVP